MSEPQPYDIPLPLPDVDPAAAAPAAATTAPAPGCGYALLIVQAVGGAPSGSISCRWCGWLQQFPVSGFGDDGEAWAALAVADWIGHASSAHPA